MCVLTVVLTGVSTPPAEGDAGTDNTSRYQVTAAGTAAEQRLMLIPLASSIILQVLTQQRRMRFLFCTFVFSLSESY